MLRRLHPEQPESFAFTAANQAWAEGQISKYPEGRQASAVIPLLWRAQEQEGWLSRPAIEHVATMLDMPYIRALEVATFYFMFQLQPVGTVAHIQVCGTTSCMICGAEDLIGICKEKIAANPHELSADGKFSWEEVECLGACSNAPMAQIGKDYYEDLDGEGFAALLDKLAAGEVPVPGPQNGRYTSEPKFGLTSLTEHEAGRDPLNASARLAADIGDTVKRIDGTEVPLVTPWLDGAGKGDGAEAAEPAAKAAPKAEAKKTEAKAEPAKAEKPAKAAPKADSKPKSDSKKATAKAAEPAAEAPEAAKPQGLERARDGQPDDLKMIKGIGPALETLCHRLGFFHFDQVAAWSEAEVAWVDQNLEGFKGRVTRDKWVDQAKLLASGGETEFARRVKKGNVYDE